VKIGRILCIERKNLDPNKEKESLSNTTIMTSATIRKAMLATCRNIMGSRTLTILVTTINSNSTESVNTDHLTIKTLMIDLTIEKINLNTKKTEKTAVKEDKLLKKGLTVEKEKNPWPNTLPESAVLTMKCQNKLPEIGNLVLRTLRPKIINHQIRMVAWSLKKGRVKEVMTRTTKPANRQKKSRMSPDLDPLNPKRTMEIKVSATFMWQAFPNALLRTLFEKPSASLDLSRM
jgi:hypothetical protein